MYKGKNLYKERYIQGETYTRWIYTKKNIYREEGIYTKRDIYKEKYI